MFFFLARQFQRSLSSRTSRRPPAWLVIGASCILFFLFMLAAAVIGVLMSPEPWSSVR